MKSLVKSRFTDGAWKNVECSRIVGEKARRKSIVVRIDNKDVGKKG
jgi:hypothetical protein